MRPTAIRSILVATDLDPSTDGVLRTAAAAAHRTAAQLHVLHAFELDRSPCDPDQAAEPPTFRSLVHSVERTLIGQIGRAVPAEPAVASRCVVEDAPHRAILRRAAEVAADLIVLGPHHTHRLGSRFLGGTADRVARAASVPCLVVHGQPTNPFRRVVAPVDVSQTGHAALDLALAWSAALAEAQVSVLHVLPRTMPGGSTWLDPAVVEPELRREVQAARQRVPAGAGLSVRAEVISGDAPAAEIIGFARGDNADLLVLATRGRGPARRALLGGVSSAVAGGASCPVLLVPPTLWREDRV